MVDRWETNWGQILQNILPGQKTFEFLKPIKIWFTSLFSKYGTGFMNMVLNINFR